MRYLQYDEFPPCHALARYVKCFWVLENFSIARADAGVVRSSMYPDGFTDFIFNFGGPIDLESAGVIYPVHNGGSAVIGQLKQVLNCTGGRIGLFGVKFHPFGLRAFFPLNADELTNRITGFGSIAGEEPCSALGSALAASLSKFDYSGAVSTLSEFFIGLMLSNRINFDIGLIRESLSVIDAAYGLARTEDIAERLGVSVRLLELRYKEVVGVSPKFYSSIVRVNKLLPVINNFRDRSFVESAMQFGYSDQSHFIRDFKRHVGFTPGEFSSHDWEIELKKPKTP